MKKILLLLLFALSMTVNAQNLYSLNSDYAIVQVFQAQGSASSICDRLLKVLAKSKVDDVSVIDNLHTVATNGCIVSHSYYGFQVGENSLTVRYAISAEAKDGKYRLTVRLTKAEDDDGEISFSRAKTSFPTQYNRVASNLSKIVETIKKGMDAETDF